MLKVNVYILQCTSPDSDGLLTETLTTLKAQDYENLQITVIENGCETSHIAGSYRRIHLEPNRGVSVGYNAGLHSFLVGDGDFALLINNDISADRSLVSELVKTAEEGLTVGIVGPRIFYYGTNRIWFDGGVFNEWTGVSRHKDIRKIGPADTKEKQTQWITGCCMLIKRQVIETVGFFDERFSPAYSEDIDYSFRVRDHGWRLMVNPKARLYHKISQSIGILKTKS